jgi:hypothetical protein
MPTSSTRFSVLCLVLVLGLSLAGFCQANDPEAAAAVASGAAGYGHVSPVDINQAQPNQLTVGSNVVFDATTGGVVGNTAGGQDGNGPNSAAGASRNNSPTIDGLDSVPTFDGAFLAQAGPSSTGTHLFRFSMMGNSPLVGGTTTIPAKIDEVSWKLLNGDGSVFKTVPFAPFEDLTLESPNFGHTTYGTGAHLQFADAIQRAEFFNTMKPNWHTTLDPNVVNSVTITVPRFVNVKLSDGTIVQARSYFTGTAADGSTFVLMLNLLFNNLFSNEVVNDINNGMFTTDSLNMTLFPNTYLFSLNVNNPNTPGGCCVLGFHTYFYEPGAIPQPRWITEYASWISPGLFGAGFQDVTGLSHETSESFNDPFLDNAAPTWQFPGQPANSKVCQANLETGDPVEVLSTATVPIPVKEGRRIFTYHPQTEALLQWFEMGKTSNAIDGAFSYPDETALPHSAVPCPQ